jgi:hypothetical protein
MICKVVGSSTDQSVLLATINGCGAVAEISAAAQADLNEYQFIAVRHHEIDLTTSRPVISFNDTKSAANEEPLGNAFGTPAEFCCACFGVRVPQSAERPTHHDSQLPTPGV